MSLLRAARPRPVFALRPPILPGSRGARAASLPLLPGSWPRAAAAGRIQGIAAGPVDGRGYRPMASG